MTADELIARITSWDAARALGSMGQHERQEIEREIRRVYTELDAARIKLAKQGAELLRRHTDT